MRPRFCRKRPGLALLVVAVAMTLLPAAPALARQDQAAPVRLSADLTCVEDGGEITLSIENLGKEPVEIMGDFHIFLSAVRPGAGQEPEGALFVFPAPGFDRIEPGQKVTFILPFGSDEPEEGGAASVEAKRLIAGAEIFFVGRQRPVVRHFSFQPCP